MIAIKLNDKKIYFRIKVHFSLHWNLYAIVDFLNFKFSLWRSKIFIYSSWRSKLTATPLFHVILCDDIFCSLLCVIQLHSVFQEDADVLPIKEIFDPGITICSFLVRKQMLLFYYCSWLHKSGCFARMVKWRSENEIVSAEQSWRGYFVPCKAPNRYFTLAQTAAHTQAHPTSNANWRKLLRKGQYACCK